MSPSWLISVKNESPHSDIWSSLRPSDNTESVLGPSQSLHHPCLSASHSPVSLLCWHQSFPVQHWHSSPSPSRWRSPKGLWPALPSSWHLRRINHLSHARGALRPSLFLSQTFLSLSQPGSPPYWVWGFRKASSVLITVERALKFLSLFTEENEVNGYACMANVHSSRTPGT